LVIGWTPARLQPAAGAGIGSRDVAIEELESSQRTPIPRQGRIRRCRVRHVAIVPGDKLPSVQVDCLLGGRDHPLPLGTMDEARPICNACTATTVWRADED
jgi:hypothetical protein